MTHNLTTTFKFLFALMITLISCGRNNSNTERIENRIEEQSVKIINTESRLTNVAPDDLSYNIFLIGYLNKKAAFKEEKTNNIYILKNDKDLSLLKKGEVELEPMFINDSGIIYKIRKGAKFELQIEKKNKKLNIPIIVGTNHVIASSNIDTVFYVEDGKDDTSDLIMLDVTKGFQEKKTDIAYYCELIGNRLYYLQLTEEGYPNVSVFVSPTHDFRKKEILLENVSLNNLYIFPTGEHIFVTKWINGKILNVVYNINRKKFASVNGDFIKENYFLFYSYDKSSIGFYHPKRHDFQYQKMPELSSFDIE